MKKIAALVLCLALMGSLFAGCQQKPKEIPPYFPHSDSLRLDANKEEILAEGFIKSSYSENFYDLETPVYINELELNANLTFYESSGFSLVYYLSDANLNLSKGYKKLLKYFVSVYGQGEAITEWPDFALDPIGTEWKFMIDTGEKYLLKLSAYSTKSGTPTINIGIVK